MQVLSYAETRPRVLRLGGAGLRRQVGVVELAHPGGEEPGKGRGSLLEHPRRPSTQLQGNLCERTTPPIKKEISFF